MSAKRVVVFSSKPYDEKYLLQTLSTKCADQSKKIEFSFVTDYLGVNTVDLAKNADAICVFVNDKEPKEVCEKLKEYGCKVIALRCAGFNNVDLQACSDLGIKVVRVPAYSPYSVAEHAMALILTLNRKIHRSFNRIRENNFALDGLIGFDLYGKTVGLLGTGKIGQCFAAICKGFGMKVLGYDPFQVEAFTALGGEYVTEDELYARSDIISLHLPLFPNTKYIINEKSISKMKDGVMIINTSRGPLLNTQDAINALKSKKIGALGVDVYENEEPLFFEDLSEKIIEDDLFSRLKNFPNVVITGHQAFFTQEALENISACTIGNLASFFDKGECPNEVPFKK